jgi:hypothetical protein
VTNRELLEKAAKAAGIAILPCACRYEQWPFKHDEAASGKRGHWNPLHDDGDALRLAAALRIDVDYDELEPHVEAYRKELGEGSVFCATECMEPDSAAATRLAIVRAAAAIGEKR